MSTNDKKDKNEELFDHIIEYGASSWTDEISPDNIPEEELSDQLNQKIDNMFSSARKRANRKRRFITAQRIAAVFVMLLTMASVTLMSVDAFREPIINFIFKSTGVNNRKVEVKQVNENPDFNFTYIPTGYKFIKKSISRQNTHYIYEYHNQKSEETLYIEIDSNTDANSYVNIDKDGYTKFVSNNTEYYFINSSYNQLLWFKNKCVYRIQAVLSKNDLLKIAEGIEH